MEAKAYAKVNLTLEVLGRRDDGYHEISTILQTIDLADILRFESASSLTIESSDASLAGEGNLVWWAADLLRRSVSHPGGAHIQLEKHIPVGMGLGGGSSDAAATLSCLNILWGLDMDDAALHKLAASLGSDVPFFLTGGTCLGAGRGEEITPLPPPPMAWVALLCPAVVPPAPDSSAPKTAHMYSMLTPDDFTDGSYTRSLSDALAGGEFSDGLLFNGFGPVARRAMPAHAEMEELLLDAGAAKMCLAGAGPALYTLLWSECEAQNIHNSLKNRGLEAYCVRTVQPSTGGGAKN